MKKKYLVTFLFFFIVFFSGVILINSSEIVNISNSSYKSQNPRVAIDQTGKIMVVWEEVIKGTSYVYYSIKSGTKWSNPAKIPGQSNKGNINPDVFRGKYSGFVVAWHNLGCNCIKFIEYNDKWTNSLTMSPSGGYDMGQPKIITTTNHRIAVAWQRGNPRMADIYVKIYSPSGGWGSVHNVSNTANGTSKYLDMYPGEHGEVIVVWQDNKESTWTEDVLEPMINMDDGKGHWGKAYDVNKINRWCFRPSVCASGGKIHVGFYYYQEKMFYSSLKSGNSWEDPKEVWPGWRHDHDRYYSDSAAYKSGMLFTFKDRDGDIAYTVYDGKSWSNASKVSLKQDAFHPAIDYSKEVGAAIVWTNRDTNEIMFINFEPDESPEPEPNPNKPPVAKFTFSPKTGLYPLKVHFDGSASKDPDGEIVKYVWTFGDGSTAKGKIVDHVFSKKGVYNVRLEVTDDDGATGSTFGTVEVLGIYSPLNQHYELVENRSLFTKEYLYKITWDRNPKNAEIGATIVNYKIYRRKKGYSSPFSFLTRLSADNFKYLDRTLGTQKIEYDYRITAVDSEGRESSIDDISISQSFNTKKH